MKLWNKVCLRWSLCLVVVAGATLMLEGQSLGLKQDIVFEHGVGNDAAFALVSRQETADLYYDTEDFPGVVRAIADLQSDIESVCSRKPLISANTPVSKQAVIVGTLGKNQIIDQLVAAGKLDVSDLRGKWESFVITTVQDPLPGVEQALIITGSDKRGTIYGIYELSEQIGVSPWYWWADVPPRQREQIYVLPGRYTSGEPAVRYRGIFLNNEAPCLSSWTQEKFGGMNASFYRKVFELLLRLRANYLWPAMWNNAFNEDDPENPRLADEYGIVMGTSHHEPMMRAHKEWTQRREQYGNGKWNYATNAEALKQFFREGIARNKSYENLVTIGMRGDGDEGMTSTGTIESDMQLLEQIFSDQRAILAEEMGVNPSEVPQLWALFTEVQKFYEHGLRPPEDVTLLWTDDNVGNLRRLPTEEERKRSGGAGIYYHFDMHGGPYAYQWINTVSLVKTAEQMHLAHAYGANQIWIVNVGDLKPLELPIEFFLRQAWDPASYNKDRLADAVLKWAQRDFGAQHAEAIAHLVSRLNKYNGWRKPELIKPDTFSQLHFREAERVELAWSELEESAEVVFQSLEAEKRDAFFQFLYHPIKVCSLVARMNVLAGRNQLYAKQGRASTNAIAEEVRSLFRQERALNEYYNHELSGGKWNHLMDQPHLGQFDWEPPVVDAMPALVEVLPESGNRIGVSVEAQPFTWPDHFGPAKLPVLDSLHPQRSFLDVFRMGEKLFSMDVSVEAQESWIVVEKEVDGYGDERHWVSIDWPRAPVGKSNGRILVTLGNGESVRVMVPIIKASEQEHQQARNCYASQDGAIVIQAIEANSSSEVNGVKWEVIPDYGRGEGAMGIYPVTAESIMPPQVSPALQYPVYLPREGQYEITLIVGPVMDFVPDRGMRIAVSLDETSPQVIDIFENRQAETFLGAGWWSQFTRDNVRFLRSTHTVESKGPHLLKIAMVDPGIVVEKIIIHDRRLPSSYFGPPANSLVE